MKENIIKKNLIEKILEYIDKVRNSQSIYNEITILVNETSQININIIEQLCKKSKIVKIVSFNIHKFTKIEEKLYNEYGIALQFSNSYRKSLLKSKIIISLDFNSIDINEYKINDKAIIINCTNDNIIIKSKLFNGIIVNSCNIRFSKEIRNIYKNIGIYDKFNNLLLYESTLRELYKNDVTEKILNEDKVEIENLIGNNGIINKKELKNA